MEVPPKLVVEIVEEGQVSSVLAGASWDQSMIKTTEEGQVSSTSVGQVRSPQQSWLRSVHDLVSRKRSGQLGKTDYQKQKAWIIGLEDWRRDVRRSGRWSGQLGKERMRYWCQCLKHM